MLNPAMLDPTGKFQRELDALDRLIVEQRAKVGDLDAQLVTLQQQLTTTPKRKGWFSDNGPSTFEIKMDLKSVQLKLDTEQPLLNDLESGYQQLITEVFPQGKVWIFDEVDHFISDLLNQFRAEAYDGGFLLPDTPSEKFSLPIREPVDKDTIEIDPFQAIGLGRALGEIFGGLATQLFDSKRSKLSGVKCYRLILYLNPLYAERRNLVSAYLQEFTTWDRYKISAELTRRRRELAESDIKLGALTSLAGGQISVQNPFMEQKRFLQQVIGELESALQRAQQPAPPVDPAAAKIAKIAELNRKMNDALNNNPPELHPDIRRVYGQLIDDERKKP